MSTHYGSPFSRQNGEHCEGNARLEGGRQSLGKLAILFVSTFHLITQHQTKGNIMTTKNTVHLHRVLAAKPEKVYRAFLEPDAMARWMPPNGFTCKVHHMDAKVGGSYKMSFTNFTTGTSISFGGEYREMVPHERLRYTDNFDDPNLAGEIQVTVTLKKVSVGTELIIVQEGIPDVIPLEACYLGWQESLKNLARLVEPEIPN
jgi:uncharacterized protein YndB with AHSA1/START domain